MNQRKTFLIVSAVLLTSSALVMAALLTGPAGGKTADGAIAGSPGTTAADAAHGAEAAARGGNKSEAAGSGLNFDGLSMPNGYGKLPAIPVSGNPAAEMIVETMRTGEHPERVSVLFAPPAFDLSAYQRDPALYLAESVPGRVFQVAQPGEQTPVLKRLSPMLHEVAQGDAITLRVRATPGMPVNWNTFDCGAFDNGLTAISVAADERGVATVAWRSTTGVIDGVEILAASPVMSGQLRFSIKVGIPAVAQSR